MAVFTKDGLLTYIDGDGNEYQLFPVTQIKQVLGLVDALAGKAPEGFGLGKTVAQHELNVDNAVAMGWHQVKNVIIPGFSDDADRWWDVFVITNMENFSTHQFLFDRYANFSTNGGSYLHRSRADGGAWGEWRWVDPPMQLNWEYRTSEHIANKSVYKRYNGKTIEYRLDGETEWKTFAELYGAAPVGYGLGSVAGADKWNGDANALTKQGWYRLESGTTNGVGASASVRVDGYAETGLTQTAYTRTGFVLQRTCVDGTWGEWEYVNPPMALGVEYRTTERWNGKAVYTKLISFGALPNTATGSISVGADELNVISLHGVSSNGNYIYDIATMPGVSEFAYNYWQGTVVIATTADKSGYKNTYITIKYTKD